MRDSACSSIDLIRNRSLSFSKKPFPRNISRSSGVRRSWKRGLFFGSISRRDRPPASTDSISRSSGCFLDPFPLVRRLKIEKEIPSRDKKRHFCGGLFPFQNPRRSCSWACLNDEEEVVVQQVAGVEIKVSLPGDVLYKRNSVSVFTKGAD
ncbi:hypothetical protein HWI79_3134 [Cryptosporidium felis]|nr:hypothetical protein HWI79_3134 [Cryptosporidium felis]